VSIAAKVSRTWCLAFSTISAGRAVAAVAASYEHAAPMTEAPPPFDASAVCCGGRPERASGRAIAATPTAPVAKVRNVRRSTSSCPITLRLLLTSSLVDDGDERLAVGERSAGTKTPRSS
jgi:hypothetical protein